MQKYCWSVRNFIWKNMLKDLHLSLKEGRLIFNSRVILKGISHMKSRIDSRAKNKTWIPKCPLGKQHSHFLAQANFLLVLYATDYVARWLAWTLSNSRQMSFKNYLSRTYWTGLVFRVLMEGLTGQDLFFECWWKVNTEEPPQITTPINPDLSLSIVTKLKILLKILTSL